MSNEQRNYKHQYEDPEDLHTNFNPDIDKPNMREGISDKILLMWICGRCNRQNTGNSHQCICLHKASISEEETTKAMDQIDKLRQIKGATNDKK